MNTDSILFAFVLPLALIVLGIVLIILGVVKMVKSKKRESEKTLQPEIKGDIQVAAMSIIGDRKYQQDYCLYPPDPNDPAIKDVGVLTVVCDGMGGMEGGEIASRHCTELVYSGFYQMGRAEDVCSLLKELIAEANKEISNITSESGKRLNCGTTIVAAVYRDSKIFWASAGDSRIYLYSGGNLAQITRDHNLLMKLRQSMEAGYITKEQMDAMPQKEALISYLGMGQGLTVDTGEFSFPQGSGNIVVLCSDGIYKTASASEITETIRLTDKLSDLPGALIDKSMSGGYPGRHDNITAITIKRN